MSDDISPSEYWSVVGKPHNEYAASRGERLQEMAATTKNIISVDRVQIVEGQPGFERNIIYGDRLEDLIAQSEPEYIPQVEPDLEIER